MSDGVPFGRSKKFFSRVTTCTNKKLVMEVFEEEEEEALTLETEVRGAQVFFFLFVSFLTLSWILHAGRVYSGALPCMVEV